MKTNFKYKIKLLKSKGYKYQDIHKHPKFFNSKHNRVIDAVVIDIMTLEQLVRFLERK